MAEGSQYESLQPAAHYKLDNLVGILDVNRLGQRGETMYGHHLEAYQVRMAAFGWETSLVDGQAFPEVLAGYTAAKQRRGRPTMIIVRTIKGKGVSFLEDQDDWHGVPLKPAELERALPELGGGGEHPGHDRNPGAYFGGAQEAKEWQAGGTAGL